MTYLFGSWKESLSLFRPNNAKLFFLVTLKSIFTAYKTIILHLGWLIILSSLLQAMIAGTLGKGSPVMLIPTLGWSIIIFCMYLIVRPSIQRKNYAYYGRFWHHFIYFILTSIAAVLIDDAIRWLFISICNCIPSLAVFNIPVFTILLLPAMGVDSYISPVVSFILFFMLDQKASFINTLRAVARGFKMGFYNYPFCLIMLIIFVGFFISINVGLMILLKSRYTSFIILMLLPIPLCVWSNFYTKRLHDQFGLYYPDTMRG